MDSRDCLGGNRQILKGGVLWSAVVRDVERQNFPLRRHQVYPHTPSVCGGNRQLRAPSGASGNVSKAQNPLGGALTAL